MARTLSRTPYERRGLLPKTFFNITYKAKKEYISLNERKEWDGKVEVLPPCGDGHDVHPKPSTSFNIEGWRE